METITIPDVPAPTRELCYVQDVRDGIVQTFKRCTFPKGHTAPHSWAIAARLEALEHALTPADVDQIAEGIENFIMDGDPEVDGIWQPYVDKLRALQQLLEQPLARDTPA